MNDRRASTQKDSFANGQAVPYFPYGRQCLLTELDRDARGGRAYAKRDDWRHRPGVDMPAPWPWITSGERVDSRELEEKIALVNLQVG